MTQMFHITRRDRGSGIFPTDLKIEVSGELIIGQTVKARIAFISDEDVRSKCLSCDWPEECPILFGKEKFIAFDMGCDETGSDIFISDMTLERYKELCEDIHS